MDTCICIYTYMCKHMYMYMYIYITYMTASTHSEMAVRKTQAALKPQTVRKSRSQEDAEGSTTLIL